MIISGKDDDEHLEKVKEVLKRLKEHDGKMCIFARKNFLLWT
jgi:hypothetical protein